MDENTIVNNGEKREKEDRRHHSSHHGSHHRSRHSSRGDSQRRVVSRTYRKVKFQKLYKPLLGIILFFASIMFLIVLIWAMFNPSVEVREAVERNKNITESVSAEVRIKELEAEIEALNAEIDDYKTKIGELEGKLAVAEAVPQE